VAGTVLRLPGNILVERDLRVPARDGITLSADVYRPVGSRRWPAILEHVPYRKSDQTAARDLALCVALARRGFACVRLDVRGTGDSDGIALDEYTEAEQEDGCEAVAWIAGQDWCTGAVGAWGTSYGGFAAIQLAARRPPALGAIAAVYATDDRYTDDVHFYGGALCALELVHYPLRILAMNALPPSTPLDAEALEAWRARIDATPPWILRWLDEQHDGPYWRNGSLRPDYESINCPTLLLGGWRDGYVNAAVRMAERLAAPCQLVVGPWPHVRPNQAPVPPRLDFVDLLASWFRRHLSGDETENGNEGALVFFQAYDDPRMTPARVSGEWRRLRGWPSGDDAVRRFHLLGEGELADAPGPEAQVTLEHAPHAGLAVGNWCPPPPPTGLPGDQRLDESYGVSFTTRPLPSAVRCLGFPRLVLAVSHPGPTALIAAKLSDVAPDGPSQLVTRTVLNLAHRDGSTAPRPLPPRVPTQVALTLDATAWTFAPEHCIRLTLYASDWPTCWPAPTTEAPTLHVGEASLELPLAPEGEPADPREEEAHGEEDEGEPLPMSSRHDQPVWRLLRDGHRHRAGIETASGHEQTLPSLGVTITELRDFSAFVCETDPLDAVVEGTTSFELRRPDCNVRTEARGRFTCTAETFRAELALDVWLDGRPLTGRRWDERIPRRLL
jgi:putative CocE/NonD family hydrolase